MTTRYPLHKRIRYRIGARLLAPHLDALYKHYDNEAANHVTDMLIGIKFGLTIALRAEPETRRPMGVLPPID